MDIVGDPGDVGVVERGVDFIKDEEWRRLVRVHGEEESKGGHCLFAAGEVFHVSEALERRHGVVFDAVEIRLVRVFDVEVAMMVNMCNVYLRTGNLRLSAQWVVGTPCKLAVDGTDLLRDV